MVKEFYDLPNEKKKALLSLAEDQLGLPDYIIEKDFWLCWILEQLFTLPLKMAFKGGTSLSKVYRLINRFSEDVDITVDYRNVIGEFDFEHASRSQIKKVSKVLKTELKVLAETKILPYLQKRVTLLFSDNSMEFVLSEDGENLRFYYPTVNKRELGYLRDHVLIEFGIRNSSEPFEEHKIQPFITDIIDDSISLPKPVVNTLSPIRTFWEKATLIHVECNRKRLTQSPERLSRHWYDLYMLYKSWVGEESINHQKILEDVIRHKIAFFNASYAHYDRCLNGEFRLIPDVEDKKSLQKDYREMVDSGMFHREFPDFNDMIDSLSNLECRLNASHRTFK